jgi:hypothetical protein
MSDVAAVQAKANLKFAAGMSSLKQGTCLSIDWASGTALVNTPGGTIPMPMAGGAPIPNARCWIGFLGNLPICLGAVSRPPLATVAGTASGGLIAVTGDDGLPYQVTYTAGATFASGDRVQVDWTSGGTIVAVPQADPNTGEPITDGGTVPGGGPQSRTFNPTGSATWRDGFYASGWVGGDVLCSDHNTGAYFYGTTIADTIPDNATDVHLSIYMSVAGGYGDNPTIGAHSLGGPGPDLSVAGPFAIPGSSGWVDITGFASGFITGAYLGIGTNHGGNWRFDSAGVNNAGAIGATWRT